MGSWKQWGRAALTAAALAVVLDLLGAGRIQVTAYALSCPGLPEAFSGLKIALITDLHGAFLEDGGQTLARAAAGADLIAISGDLFDRDTHLEQVIPAIRSLCRMAPVYYVSGNHEWTVEGRREVWAQMEEAGAILLDHRWVTLERQGASITLAGIQDPNGPADQASPESVFAGMPQDRFTILLYHRNTEPQVWGPLGADLILSGHGHGGLVRLPLVGGLADAGRGLFPRYDAGVYQVQGATLVVSRGLGTTPAASACSTGRKCLCSLWSPDSLPWQVHSRFRWDRTIRTAAATWNCNVTCHWQAKRSHGAIHLPLYPPGKEKCFCRDCTIKKICFLGSVLL